MSKGNARWLAAGIETVLAVLAGCASPGDYPGIEGAGLPPDPTPSEPCAVPSEGCPCSDPGQAITCGDVVQKAGDYVTCSQGARTCGSDGQWGACVGDFTYKSRTPAGRGEVHYKLNAPAACINNPCDPGCETFMDDGSGLDAGVDSGLNITDAGVSLYGNPVPQSVCSSLSVAPTPGSIVITSMAPSPNTASFTASIGPANCYAGTPTYLWSINKYDVAQISTSGLLTVAVPYAVPISVTAYAGTLSASTVCNVTVNVVDTSAAPAGYSNTQFPATTGVADGISIVYPYPGTVFPLGLSPPLIQWQNNNSPATTASAVKVTLRYPSTGTPTFSWAEIVPELQTQPTPTLPGQPRALISASVWQAFQQTVVRNSGASGGDAVIAVQRYVSGALRGEVNETIHVANGQLKGNIYYNSYGTNLVQNYGYTLGGAAFGAATLAVATNGTVPNVIVGYNDPTLSGAGCRVCHYASADGSTIISNSDLANGNSGSGNEATTWAYNATLTTPSLIQGSQALIGTSYGTNKFTFAALSPDGTYMLTSAAPAGTGGASGLYTLAGNAITTNFPSSLGAATTTFSSDAAHVAFNFYSGKASPLSTLSADAKSIAMMDFAAPGTFSNFRVLSTPPSTAAYSLWPTFLPPGQNGVVFQNEITVNGRDWGGTRSQCDSTGTCNNVGATGELWWVSTGTTPVATRLANLNGGSYLPRSPAGANYHGTSAQNSTYYEEVYNYEPSVLPVTIGGYSWVAFTSRRLYGNVATINPYWSDPRFQNLTVQPTTKKIWIAAIATNPTPGTDPSFPAFYLQGQELLAGNARAYFDAAPCELPGPPTAANLCTSNLDCCGAATNMAVCQLDPPPLGNPPTSHCVAVTGSSCVADGSSCSSDTQCCNFTTGSRCGSGVCDPAPPIVDYYPAPFVTQYQATCATEGQLPVWRYFYWQSNTPNGTSIAFTASTSPDGVNWGVPTAIGTAAPPPNVTATWTSGPQTVDAALRGALQASLPYLKVTAVLSPDSTNTLTPVLTAWQLTYDCISGE